MRKDNISKKVNRMSWKGCLVFCLLLVYGLQSISVELLHQFVHDHKHETELLHTTVQERDPCHRAIFHDDKSQGCDHKFHLAKKTTCSFKEFCIKNKHIAPDRFFTRLHTSFSHFDYPHAIFSVAEKLTHLPSRAPPVLSFN